MKKIISVIASVLLLSSCAATQTQSEPNAIPNQSGSISSPSNPRSSNFGQFNGTWIGELQSLDGKNIDQEKSYTGTRQFKIELSGDKALVYRWKSNKWQRFWQDDYIDYFFVAPSDTNAVIYQTKSGRDANCLWVETWALNLTKTDTHTADAYFNRTVNNRECKTEDDGIWNKSGHISLKRID